MTIYFSKSSLSFFDTDLSSGNPPKDGIEITKEKRDEILNAPVGFIISSDKNGYPILIKYIQTENETKEILLSKIDSIERKYLMPRSLRDLLLSSSSINETAKTKIQEIESQIETLREGL